MGALTRDFQVMQDSLKDHIRQLMETTAARERMESELKIAHDIQMSILPKTFPPFPTRDEFDLFALIAPAREVGGDFYDFFPLSENLLCFVIGDVSGKGVPAALFMAVTKTLIKSVARDNVTPDAILSHVNEELATDNDACMFVTLFCGVFDMTSGELRYANAGHNPPAVIKKDGTVQWLPRSGALVAGAMTGMQYACEKLLLSPGDSLYLYTDGVTEAMNPADEMYSEERLEKNLATSAGKDITDIIHEVTESVQRFCRRGAPVRRHHHVDDPVFRKMTTVAAENPGILGPVAGSFDLQHSLCHTPRDTGPGVVQARMRGVSWIGGANLSIERSGVGLQRLTQDNPWSDGPYRTSWRL